MDSTEPQLNPSEFNQAVTSLITQRKELEQRTLENQQMVLIQQTSWQNSLDDDEIDEFPTQTTTTSLPTTPALLGIVPDHSTETIATTQIIEPSTENITHQESNNTEASLSIGIPTSTSEMQSITQPSPSVSDPMEL